MKRYPPRPNGVFFIFGGDALSTAPWATEPPPPPGPPPGSWDSPESRPQDAPSYGPQAPSPAQAATARGGRPRGFFLDRYVF
ncbi:MAG: hypothetical protein KQJ78_09595 [Deltaproteobacteria bacterium]|nr:hypothetical protein [Deltaproteobacteria bacterium]